MCMFFCPFSVFFFLVFIHLWMFSVCTLCFFPLIFLFSLLGFSFILGCFDLVCMFFPLLLFWLLSFHPSLDDFTLSLCFLSLFSPPSSHLIVFILGCFHINHVCVCPLFLFLLIGIHPSIHPLDVSPCVYAFIFPFFFICFLVFIHALIPWMFSPCVCAFLFPLFLFSLLGIHPSIHPLDVFTLFAHVCFFFTFFNFASCLFSFMSGFFSSIRLHLLLLPLLLRIALLLLLCCCWLVLSARKRWAKKF